MRIHVASILVEDQSEALAFYAGKLGFETKFDLPMGDGLRWLTLVSPEDREGTELLLEPCAHPAAKAYKAALYADGIPAASFLVRDMEAERRRLSAAGVGFARAPEDRGAATVAVVDDGCGNLIQLVEPKAP